MHFIGITTETITDGGKENPNISGYTFGTNGAKAAAGDVILCKSGDNIDKEFVWTGSTWEHLGQDSSFALNDEVVKIVGD